MNRNEVFDKLLEKLKNEYDNGPALVYIPTFIQDLGGDDKYGLYICEQLEELAIVTPQNRSGKPYMWRVRLNAKGSDWLEKYGNWSGYQKSKEAETNTGIVLNVSQTQTQSQNVNITIINQILERSLSPEQMQEIKDIVNSSQNDVDKKNGIIQKLGSFGKGVIENIVSNLITEALLKKS